MISENTSVNECYDGYNANLKSVDRISFRDGTKTVIVPFKEICAYYKQDSKIMRGYYYDIVLIVGSRKVRVNFLSKAKRNQAFDTLTKRLGAWVKYG